MLLFPRFGDLASKKAIIIVPIMPRTPIPIRLKYVDRARDMILSSLSMTGQHFNMVYDFTFRKFPVIELGLDKLLGFATGVVHEYFFQTDFLLVEIADGNPGRYELVENSGRIDGCIFQSE